MGLLAGLTFFAEASPAAAGNSIHSYIVPVLGFLDAIAGLGCAIALIYGGYLYVASSADPERLNFAKRIIRNALIGFLIVLTAAVLTAVLNHAYTAPAPGNESGLPALKIVEPQQPQNWADILLNALSGLFSYIAMSMASPIFDGLSNLPNSTPLMSAQGPVFNFWLVMLAIANGLLVLVVALLGLRVMSGELLGLGDVDIKSLLPQIALAFLLMNTSIFIIDGLIGLSNAIIQAIFAGFPNADIWHTLVSAIGRTGFSINSIPFVSLIFFMFLLILAAMLFVYYVARMIALFIGAAVAPLVVLLWLLPGFRDFALNFVRTYLAVIFTLLVHVIILMLAASMIDWQNSSANGQPNILMVTIICIATILMLLKTQRVLQQMSILSAGASNSRRMAKQFIYGVQYTVGKANAYRGSKLASATEAAVEVVE